MDKKQWIAHAIVTFSNQVTQDSWERERVVLDLKDDETIEHLRVRAFDAIGKVGDYPQAVEIIYKTR